MNPEGIKLTYQRLFSAGNFEHIKVGFEVETTKDSMGEDYQKLVAAAIALKENGLEIERKFLYDETTKKRIKELQDELKGLQAQLPEGDSVE